MQKLNRKAVRKVVRLLLILGVCRATSGSYAQTMPPLPRLEALFLRADQSPRLANGDSTTAGIEALIRSRLAYKPTAAEAAMDWYSASVTFTIGTDGRVRDVRVLPRDAARFEQAVLVATRGLPRFVPGRRQGMPVAVRYTLSVGLKGPSRANSTDGGIRLPPDWDDVEKWVPQPPHLPGQESFGEAMYAELQRLPSVAPSTSRANRVDLSFTVDNTGQIIDLLINNNADLAHCQAVMQALRRLPRFEPGRDADNQPVAVRLNSSVDFPQPGAPLVARAAPASPSAASRVKKSEPTKSVPPPKPASPKVYEYVEYMPQLLTKAGKQDIGEAIQQRIELPAGATCSGPVFVSFVVEASGEVSKARVVKGAGPSCDKAVLAAVRKLPRFEPGQQNGVRVAVAYTVRVSLP